MMFLALAWGFAEATLFFIVPDVLLSFVTLKRGFRTGAKAAVLASLGAAAGGITMYGWAAGNPEAALSALLAVPAIDARLVARVVADFPAGGYPAMLEGAFTGIPYKIYAVVAGTTGMRPGVFILMTPLVRLPRFLLAVALTAGARKLLPPRLGPTAGTVILALFWLVFYAVYFYAMA